MNADTPEGAVPAGYAELLEQLKARVRSTQVRAARAGNTEVLRLYWSIGRDILDRQASEGWGTGVITRLAADLKMEFPGQRGWSRRNLLYMRAFAAAWPDLAEFGHQPGAQLPWRHLTTLLDRLDSRQERDWYAGRAVAEGWSRAVLEFGIGSGLRARVGAAPSNFTAQLPPADSDLAQALVRDPYVFDTLGLAAPIAERDLEQALMDRLQATLLGWQVRLDVGDSYEVVLDPLGVQRRSAVLRRRRAQGRSPRAGGCGAARGVRRGRRRQAPPPRGPPSERVAAALDTSTLPGAGGGGDLGAGQ